MQLFGQKDAEGIYRPFHIYSMRQAIEEHFILDVLQNYMTYKMYYKIAKIIEDDKERIQWFAAKQANARDAFLSGVVLTMPSVWKAA